MRLAVWALTPRIPRMNRVWATAVQKTPRTASRARSLPESLGTAPRRTGRRASAGEQVLIEGDAQARVPPRKPPVQDGEDGEGRPRQKTP